MPVLKVRYLAAVALQFFSSIKSIVSMTLSNQTLRILTVNGFAFALAVWCVMATRYRTFVRSLSAPLKAFQYVFLGAFYVTALIGILNTEHEVSFMLLGE